MLLYNNKIERKDNNNNNKNKKEIHRTLRYDDMNRKNLIDMKNESEKLRK